MTAGGKPCQAHTRDTGAGSLLAWKDHEHHHELQKRRLGPAAWLAAWPFSKEICFNFKSLARGFQFVAPGSWACWAPHFCQSGCDPLIFHEQEYCLVLGTTMQSILLDTANESTEMH